MGPNRDNRLTWHRNAASGPFVPFHRETDPPFDDFFQFFDIRLPALGQFGRGGANVEFSETETETDTEIAVSAELNGMEENDVELTLDKGMLTLQGEKTSETQDADKQFSNAAMAASNAASRSANWAWNEYLLDQATTDGMPENGRVSRFDEVERALLELETGRRSVDAAARTVAEDTGSIPENGLGAIESEIRLMSAHTPIRGAGGGATGSRQGRQPDDARACEFSPAADPTIRQRPLDLRPT